MFPYTSTFISGFQDVIREHLPTVVRDAQIRRCDDGIILYDSALPAAHIAALRFFNNTFAVLAQYDIVGKDPLQRLATHVRGDDAWLEKLRSSFPKARTYTLRSSVENHMAALHPIARQKLERMLGDTGMKQGGANADIDLWLMTRREGYGFLGVRITRQEAELAKGELRPELAHLLCVVSGPSPSDRFLDPFCGSGAIAIERLRAFPATDVWAGDNDRALVRLLCERVSKRLHVEVMDALNLTQFADASIDVIVTDPPWGHFAASTNLAAMLDEFAHVVRPGGRIVLLLARDAELEHHLAGLPLTQRRRLDVLVSGRKASVHVLERMEQ